MTSTIWFSEGAMHWRPLWGWKCSRKFLTM